MKKQLISKIIWTAIAVVLWVVGLVIFTNYLKGENGLAGYLIWGALCAVCTIKSVMSGAKKEGVKGRRRGANDYTVTDNGSHYTVQNHPLRGAITGFIGGLIGGVIAGPIVVPINTLKNVVAIVNIAKQMKK